MLNTSFNTQLWMNESPMDGLAVPPSTGKYKIKSIKYCLKPSQAFWTSTAVKIKNNYTSAWVDWVTNNQPSWLSPEGFIFKVKSSAKVLLVGNDNDVMQIYKKYSGKKVPPEFDMVKKRFFIFENFPWKSIANDYVGIHYVSEHYEAYSLLSSWDCESTVWFDMNALELVSKVSISQS